MTLHQSDVDFASLVSKLLVGKTIESAQPFDAHCPVHQVKITFTDGTIATIQGQEDEGFVIWLD